MENSISDFKNKHIGERVFLIGNGPSLRETPLDKLQDEYTIAMNKIDLVYSSVDWRPSYFVYVRSPPPTEERIKHYEKSIHLGIPAFVSEDNKKFLPKSNNIFYIKRDDTVSKSECHDFNSGKEIIGSCWSRDIERVVYRSVSSMYVAAQIASYMGFAEMYFVGCDGYVENKTGKTISFPKVVFPKGNNPEEYKQDEILKFLRENGTPIRSFINGLSYKLSKYNLVVLDHGTDVNHFNKDYNKKANKNIISESKAKQRNKNLRHMHHTIEELGKFENYETYNATISRNINIHQAVNLDNIVG